jgi:hypothetical protein
MSFNFREFALLTEIGSFIKMTKPNFTQMTRKELKTYIRQQPTDDEAIRELFVNRRDKNAKTYPFPYRMTKEELDNVFRSKRIN